MKPAHTIVEPHPSVLGVPAYLRKALKQSGPKVKIGCAYRPRIVPEPAFHVTPKKPSRIRKAALWAGVIAAIGVLYAIGSTWSGQ